MSLPEPFDLFVDLSASGLDAKALNQYLERLEHEAGLVHDSRTVFLAPPGGVKAPAIPGIRPLPDRPAAALGVALGAAATRGRGLAVVQGAWLPGNEVIAALACLHEADPMIGSVQPRFASPTEDNVLSLPDEQGGSARLPRAALPLLPATTLTPELAAPLVLLPARAVLAAAQPPDIALPDALLALLTGLRRKGFRNLVSNRVVVSCPLEPALIYPPPSLGEICAAPAWRNDMERARRWLARQPERSLEVLLAGAFTPDGRARILLDCRGAAALHNGTAQAILGFLDGFTRLRTPRFAFTVLATREAAAFHGLEKRYPGLHVEYDQPARTYLAAVLLNQPWDVARLRELHRCSYLLGFNILDTISWDIIYVAEERLDRVWQVVASLSDMLFFNSAFTRDRYTYRFRVAKDMPLVVTHHSVDPAELKLAPAGEPLVETPYLLIAGNSYDHKDVEQTALRLTDAFPYLRIVALGAKGACGPRVTALRSGYLSDAQIAALEAHAAAIIYPSYYEGFGLPVVQGLARGRTVIARRSALWEEIAGLVDLPGNIVPFHDDASLVEAVGRALRGLAPAALKGDRTTPSSPPDWAACAGRILHQIERSLEADARHAWYERELLLSLAA
ncbi:MAG TPA: glycosyltransferase [Roseomonas sp.]|nr:glycosyltransferase [Roseomonas sp.]